MKFNLLLSLCVLCVFVLMTSVTFAQKTQPAGDNWIAKWWGPSLVTNTGGFNVSAQIDYFKEGTGGKITYETASTVKGIPSKKDVIKLKKENGGDLQWKVITINVDDQNNMSTSHGLPDQSNITWHGILVIDSPKAYKTTGHFAHDDHAQVWLNGKKIYDNPAWTGAVKNTKPADVEFVNGKNVLLFKCGESGGADYINLHFEKGDTALKIFPTTDDKFEEFVLPVEPQDKLPTQWGRLKRFYQ